MSGALVSTLVGLAASNLGIISSQAPAFAVVLNFLLPLAVPLLLFRADLRRVVQSTGKLLLAFLIGSGNRSLSCCILVTGVVLWQQKALTLLNIHNVPMVMLLSF